MAELQHSQVKLKLLDGVVPLIDMTDVRAQAAGQSETHALSRAVAATALCMTANVELAQAVASLVDGGDDNGIDAIHYDSQARTLFLIQSKWNTLHSGSVDSAAVLKYLHGVQDLVSQKKNRFNSKIRARWPVIEDALTRLSSVRLVLAYSGSTKIDSAIQERIDEFVRSQNDISELFFSEKISKKNSFSILCKRRHRLKLI